MDLDVAHEFLEGAELALEKGLYRVAAANGYYAMFWAARAALRHVGIVRDEWSHGGLLHAYGLELVKHRELLPPNTSEWLKDAYTLRSVAHYDPDGVGTKKTRRSVLHARHMTTQVRELMEK